MKLDDLRVTITVAVCITAAALMAMSANAHDRAAGIDLDELKAEAETRFAAADADSDGSVSLSEFEAADLGPEHRLDRQVRRAPWQFRGPGRRGDGPGQVFDEADTDDNGELSKAEFEAMPDAVSRLAKRRLFSRLDENDDASLTRDEFAPRYNRLAALDANSDGQVTRDEMPRRFRRGPR
ncbi:MAG: hypothetical protein OXH15_07935 [Gammaproteobacteria bacterium]|nr:hypothetical protein [Gammaproteobacteria bacterium]